MPNMSYCRFENTLNDLEDCAEHLHDELRSTDEEKARKRLIELCKQIANENETGWEKINNSFGL